MLPQLLFIIRRVYLLSRTPQAFDAAKIFCRLQINVAGETFLARRLHPHTTEWNDVSQSAAARFYRSEVPGENLEIGPIKCLSDLLPIVLRHDLVVGVNVWDVLLVVGLVLLKADRRIDQLKKDLVIELVAIIYTQTGFIWKFSVLRLYLAEKTFIFQINFLLSSVFTSLQAFFVTQSFLSLNLLFCLYSCERFDIIWLFELKFWGYWGNLYIFGV